MESRNSNEKPAARGNGIDGEGNPKIPPQTVELILGEIAAGAELSAVAGKYGVTPEVVLAWQAGKSQGAAEASTSRTTGRFLKRLPILRTRRPSLSATNRGPRD